MMMNVYKSISELAFEKNITATIGNFDGVHLGHQKMLKELKFKSENLQSKLVVITFVPHPQKILKPDLHSFLITSYEERRRYLLETGVDYIVELTFDRDFSTITAQDFLQEYVFSATNLKALFLGHDFSFGANKEGSFQLAETLGKECKVTVERQKKFELDAVRFSSSEVRGYIQQGEMKSAYKFLGRPFKLEGRVIKGKGRGKKMGFPTANIMNDEDLIIPHRGVYLTQTEKNGEVFHSITNVGFNPTVEDRTKLSVETHILDFNDDIYGETLLVRFLDKIRDEKKFASIEELIKQITIDTQNARKYFNI
jgi:riboflavin kinase/FMN adenylyltransferase